MNRSITTTCYCADPACEGFDGFTVTWHGGLDYPLEPTSDSCPHCGHEMVDELPAWEDAIAALLDELGFVEGFEMDARALYGAVWQELERQRREAWRAKSAARKGAAA